MSEVIITRANHVTINNGDSPPSEFYDTLCIHIDDYVDNDLESIKKGLCVEKTINPFGEVVNEANESRSDIIFRFPKRLVKKVSTKYVNNLCAICLLF